MTEDQDVVSLTGNQSVGGHHALVFAMSEDQPVGMTRPWKDQDQLQTRLVGGVGGEGGANVTLPDGVVFRVRKGYSLVVQVHYLNATNHAITGTTTIDLKLAPASPSKKVASLFASVSDRVAVPPGTSSLDVSCTFPHDMSFLMYSNHMHKYGAETDTHSITADGTDTLVKSDPSWNYEWAFNPNFDRRSGDDPFVVKAGTTLRTHCSWNNDSGATVNFPDEMCIFFGIVLSDKDIFCTDQKWIE
jgi:hypothetical protein